MRQDLKRSKPKPLEGSQADFIVIRIQAGRSRERDVRRENMSSRAQTGQDAAAIGEFAQK